MIDEEGMPIHQYPSQKGKLHLKFVIDFPKEISEEGKNILKMIFELGRV